MQRRIGHHHATDLDRREPRHRRDCACAPDLYINVQHGGAHLLRREFVRNRPTRRARDKAELALLRGIIDFIHHAINVKRQGRTRPTRLLIKFN